MTSTDLSNDDLQKVKSLVSYSLFLQILSVMGNFAFEFKKNDAVQKLRDFMTSFTESLNDMEKAEYQKRVDALLQEKGTELVEAFGKEFSASELEELLTRLIEE